MVSLQNNMEMEGRSETFLDASKYKVFSLYYLHVDTFT